MAGRSFQPGNPGGGRTKGARNKLSADFLENLSADFAEHGAAVIRVACGAADRIFENCGQYSAERAGNL